LKFTTETSEVDLAGLGETWSSLENVDTSPEVAEVIARMPWWATRGVLYVMIVFSLVAVVWTSVAQVDLVVAARGSLVPQGNVKPVQPASSGVVQSVFVKEGDEVKRGDPLLQLDASEMRIRLNKLRQELTTSQSQLAQMMVNRPFGETLEQQNRIARLQTEISAAEVMLQHTTITAPATGIVTTMNVRSVGEVLQPGKTIATIAPGDVPLVVEVELPNKDIAFVEKGMAAKLKFDAFPFQDYGIVDGTVIEVSPDAQVNSDSGSFYKLTIALNRKTISINGKEVVLRPGLLVSAEIVTERRTIASLLLEPFRKVGNEIVR